MNRAFTIVEVSILFVIFLIVAFLVVPLSLDDTMQAKNASNWMKVQQEFANIFDSINMQKENKDFDLYKTFDKVMGIAVKDSIKPYKITYMNGTFPNNSYRFTDYKQTVGGKVLAYKFLDEPEGDLIGYLMYDVNGVQGPNVWGNDVFGLNIYTDRFEPFCKNDSRAIQQQECAKQGTGLCCSNLFLIGGNLN